MPFYRTATSFFTVCFVFRIFKNINCCHSAASFASHDLSHSLSLCTAIECRACIYVAAGARRAPPITKRTNRLTRRHRTTPSCSSFSAVQL